MLLASLHSHSWSVQNPRTAWDRVIGGSLMEGSVFVRDLIPATHAS